MLHVLIIDTPDNRQNIREFLREEGMPPVEIVAECDNSVSAYTILQSTPGITLVICAYLLPDRNGLEVLQFLRRGMRLECAVILCTKQMTNMEDIKQLRHRVGDARGHLAHYDGDDLAITLRRIIPAAA